MMEFFDVDKMLVDAIDMHMHTAPDVMPSRLSGLEAARQAKEVGMRAIILKNHFFNTAPIATMVRELVPGIEVFGGVCLDEEVGGLNPHALRSAAQFGAKIVWMATLSAANTRNKMKREIRKANPSDPMLATVSDGYSVLDANGRLVPEVYPILDIVKEYDLILASGHISTAEIFALFEAAKIKGIEKMLVTHASNSDVSDSTPSLEEQVKLARMGVFLEHTGVDIMPDAFAHDPNELADMIKAAGPEHCVLSTDAGMIQGLYPVEQMRVFISTLLGKGITPDEIKTMVAVNPAKLLGLD
jgi:hypothetical protein